jgi:hypothetical protein
MTEEPLWVALKDVCGQYGMTLGSARNAIAAGRFPVPTYRLGKLIVIDRAVHEEFFRRHREAGLRALKNNNPVIGQPDGSDDE